MYDEIIRFLDEHRLKDALVVLHAMAKEVEDWPASLEVERLQTTYNYMLQYASQGVDDPERGKIYQSTSVAAYELASNVDFKARSRKATGFFGEKYRLMHSASVRPLEGLRSELETFDENLGMLQLEEMSEEERGNKRKQLIGRHEKTIDKLFDWAWTSSLWTEEESHELNAILQSQRVAVNALCVLVGAVTLSLLGLFDKRKFQFLVNACRSDADALVSQRALVGLMLVAYFQEQRIQRYPELKQAISSLVEKPDTPQRMFDIQKIFLLCRETEQIGKRMTEDIIPQMLKEYDLHFKDVPMDEMDEMMENPLWQSKISHLRNSIDELGRLQQEGADTNMVTFSRLKNFPFFYQAAHWFYLFDMKTSEVEKLFAANKGIGKKSFFDVLLASHLFCNSDKYSFCLMAGFMSPEQMQTVTGQSFPKGESLNGAVVSSSVEQEAGADLTAIARQYIHDLYRFYKLWQYKGEQADIFQSPLSFWKNDLLKPLMGTDEILRGIADYLFEKNYLKEASEIYEDLSGRLREDAELWQKIGYVSQKNKDYEKAVDAYLKAEMINPDDVWTQEGIATCYRRMENYGQALAYYQKLETQKPDKLSVTSMIGQCHVCMNQFDKALPYFFKQEYFEKSPQRAWRAIAWCYFMMGKYAEAESFYTKLASEGKADAVDWLNYGHVLFVQRRMPEALECYRKAEQAGGGADEFRRLFLTDSRILQDKGVGEENIYMLPEML